MLRGEVRGLADVAGLRAAAVRRGGGAFSVFAGTFAVFATVDLRAVGLIDAVVLSVADAAAGGVVAAFGFAVAFGLATARVLAGVSALVLLAFTADFAGVLRGFAGDLAPLGVPDSVDVVGAFAITQLHWFRGCNQPDANRFPASIKSARLFPTLAKWWLVERTQLA